VVSANTAASTATTPTARFRTLLRFAGTGFIPLRLRHTGTANREETKRWKGASFANGRPERRLGVDHRPPVRKHDARVRCAVIRRDDVHPEWGREGTAQRFCRVPMSIILS